MKCSPLLIILTSGALLSCLAQTAAAAQETIALSFDLPAPYPQNAADAAEEVANDSAQANTVAIAAAAPAPLPIPVAATNPPQSQLGSDRLPTSVYRGQPSSSEIATAAGAGVQPLPPPPGMDAAVLAIAQAGNKSTPAFQPQAQNVANSQPRQNRQSPSSDLPPPANQPDQATDIALHFDIGPSAADLAVAQAAPQRPPLTPAEQFQAFFEGNSNSLVARAVGSAEGTRTASGDRTAAFYGHTDPGNGVWNMGTFSYQHGAKTPEEADERQLKRLQKQAQVLMDQADAQGLTLTLEEKLNAIDLANQAPATAMGRYGYVQRLAEARQMGLKDRDAIVWARTYAFKNPETQRWNAPGLGNTLGGVTRDQERRMQAIARAVAAYEQQYPDHLALQAPDSLPSTATKSESPSTIPTPSPAPEDILFQLWPNQPQAHQPAAAPPAPQPPSAAAPPEPTAIAPIPRPVAEPTPMATAAAAETPATTLATAPNDSAMGTMPGLGAAGQPTKFATGEASQTVIPPKELSMPSGEPLEKIFTLDTPPTMANF